MKKTVHVISCFFDWNVTSRAYASRAECVAFLTGVLKQIEGPETIAAILADGIDIEDYAHDVGRFAYAIEAHELEF